MTADQPIPITAAELAELAGTEAGRVSEVTDAGLLNPDPNGRYPAGDAHRLRIIDAFIEAGIPLRALVEAKAQNLISFAYYDQLHAAPGRLSTRTYGELMVDLGDRATLLAQLVTALGLAEPEARTRLPERDEELLIELLGVVEGTGTPDLALRVARLLGDGTRRATEAILTVYGEAVERALGGVVGLPSQDANDRFLQPWNRYARIAPELGGWLTARHLSNAIDAFTVANSEESFAWAGFIPPRDDMPPAIAFVDLAGFTRYAVERGDEPAARVALEFGQLAERHARAAGGRMVKLLGDGALLQFGSLTDATDATLELLDELPGAGLPAGHAGIDAGPIIVRDGDVFGRTVNRASRIADVADAGSVLMPAPLAEAGLPAGGYAVAHIGSATLSGFPQPVDLARVTRRTASPP